MAVTKAPLMSLDASGSIAGAIVFSKWKGRNYVRELVTPANPKSGLQVGMRAILRFCSQDYKNLGATIQARWLTVGKPESITAINAFVKQNGINGRRNIGMLKDPTLTAGAVEAAPTGLSYTAAPKSVNIAWTDSAGANDWCTFIWRSITTGFTPDISNLIAIIAKGVEKYTDPQRVTGTPLYYVLGGCEVGSTIGTHAAQGTATPT